MKRVVEIPPLPVPQPKIQSLPVWWLLYLPVAYFRYEAISDGADINSIEGSLRSVDRVALWKALRYNGVLD